MARKRREYSRELKLKAVRLVTEGGRSVSQAVRDFGVHQTLLGRWKKQLEGCPLEAFPGKGRSCPDDEELRSLRRELEVVRQERDILKKAIGTFSRAK